jgi:hypothetical protein
VDVPIRDRVVVECEGATEGADVEVRVGADLAVDADAVGSGVVITADESSTDGATLGAAAGAAKCLPLPQPASAPPSSSAIAAAAVPVRASERAGPLFASELGTTWTPSR